MNDNGLAHYVGSGTRSNGPVFGSYFKRTGAVIANFEVCNVASVKLAIVLHAFAMGLVHRIPVRPGGRGIGCAAVARLMKVNGVCAGSSALYLEGHLHTIAGFFKGCLTHE